MMLRTFAALFVASGMILAAAPASAQVVETSNEIGLRFETGVGGAIGAAHGAHHPQGDIRIGYDLPMGLTPMIGFGVRSNSYTLYDSDDEKIGSRGQTDIVINAELRYYFSAHRRGLQPFVFGAFDTTIASYGTEDGDGEPVNELQDKVSGDEDSFVNLNAGLGMEYKFDKSFAVGAKWGLGLRFQGTSEQELDDETRGSNTSNTTFGTSAAFYLAYRI